MSAFSLPTQRCFYRLVIQVVFLSLFSAYAEVFLINAGGLRGQSPFLCLRRGVSSTTAAASPSVSFSLPTQRCFEERSSKLFKVFLFSAYAEVFPRQG